jgi:hypothetical protein
MDEFGCDIDTAEAAVEVNEARLMTVKTKLDEKVSGLRAELSRLGNSVPISDGLNPGGGV